MWRWSRHESLHSRRSHAVVIRNTATVAAAREHTKVRVGPAGRKAMKRILILGAAGRDFHNFNVIFRNNPDYQVVAFTATQIPDISNRRYPAELAGSRQYPDGIPIFEEKDLEKLITDERVDAVVFAYSDISHQNLMHLASWLPERTSGCWGPIVLNSSRQCQWFPFARCEPAAARVRCRDWWPPNYGARVGNRF